MSHVHRQSRRRVLLALEEGALHRGQQQEALRNCIRLGAQLDIMLVHPPGCPPALPSSLMLHLEHSGMDYRFAQIGGVLSEEVQRYLRRGRQPSTVIVAKASRLTPSCMETVVRGDHHLIDLSVTSKTEEGADAGMTAAEFGGRQAELLPT